MTWNIRHEGSPRSIEGLTQAQVIEGLQDGLWEPTDEIMGAGESRWVHLEDHPQFAELAAELEPPPPPHYDDETRLDMNPLIDVCLVLLIFFILTTTYATLEKVLDLPNLSAQQLGTVKIVSNSEVEKNIIKVGARVENGNPVIRVEDEVVAPENLTAALRRYVSETKKTELVLDAQGVSWGTVVLIQDAAKGAKIQHFHFLVQPKEAGGS